MQKYIRVHSIEQRNKIHDKLGMLHHGGDYTFPLLINAEIGGWVLNNPSHPDWPIIEAADFLKENIIGYRLIKKYPGAFTLGTIIRLKETTILPDDFWDPEFWEPVYDDRPRVIRVPYSEGVLDVVIEGEWVMWEDYGFKKQDIENVLKGSDEPSAVFIIIPTEFSVGCKKGIKRESLVEILKAMS